MKNKIEAVIFDFGRVLLDFDHRIAARRIAEFSDKTEAEIFELIFDSGLTEQFEEGRVSPREFFAKIRALLNLRINYREFVPIWDEIFFFTEKNLAVYNLARALKANYRVALLSNINILHFEYIKKTFPVLDAFHHVITSYEAGYRKPKEQIYRGALRVLKAPAQSCFYTDDRPELVQGARRLGIRSFVFRGPAKLKRDLASAGIKID